MQRIDLKLDGDNAWPDLKDGEIIRIGNDATISIARLDGGTKSGKTSVAFRLDLDDRKTVIMEMSLNALHQAVLTMVAADEGKRRAQKENTNGTLGHYTGLITMEDVRSAKPTMIFYGANTCWWTHDPDHLGRTDSGLPCDPRGGMLFQTESVEKFLNAAELNAEHYGRHGLMAFMAAHHQNCVKAKEDRTPWCFSAWEEYNRILDACS